MKNMEASVLAKLKNKSKEQNIPLQQLLNLFSQEEFIRRLSVSKYSKNLILSRKLQEAIYETLSNRDTPYEADSIIVIKRLVNDKEIINRWDNFCKKTLKYELDFNDVVDVIIDFIFPPYDAMIKGNELFRNWSYQDKNYI